MFEWKGIRSNAVKIEEFSLTHGYCGKKVCVGRVLKSYVRIPGNL